MAVRHSAETTGSRARIRSLSTRVPPHLLSQDEIRGMARDLFRPRMPDFDRLEKIFGNAGVETRASCVPLRWFRDPHGWPERNALYQGSRSISSPRCRATSAAPAPSPRGTACPRRWRPHAPPDAAPPPAGRSSAARARPRPAGSLDRRRRTGDGRDRLRSAPASARAPPAGGCRRSRRRARRPQRGRPRCRAGSAAAGPRPRPPRRRACRRTRCRSASHD